jgi:hypothetical protein
LTTRAVRFSRLAALFVGVSLSAQQVADPDFDASVKQPAHTREHPRVVIDEAHHNFHTADGRYKPFAALLRNDGYEVQRGTSSFSAASLKGVRVLVIANALGEGATAGSDASPPAFTGAECAAVGAWVRAGGSLLLISDHMPMGEAAENLARVFGVAMGKGFVMSTDERRHRPNQASALVFSRDNDRLGDHPITRGRNDAERIDTVVSFTGQSLSVPAGAVALLRLGADAWEAPTRSALQRLASDAAAAAPGAPFRSTFGAPAGGRAQGVALTWGAGRVVMLGEAAMMSAQVFPAAGGGQGRMGMNVPGSDDKQLALNILRWLSGVL